jgi:hypothetical protein
MSTGPNQKESAVGAAALGVEDIESQIDRAFASNALKEEGFAQATWTLLSQTEDGYLKILHQASHEDELHIFVDIRLNALTYPLRVCYRECMSKSHAFTTEYVESHYKLACDWLKLADHDYYNFSSIFPLWHRGRVRVTVERGRLKTEDVETTDKPYEVYNRLVRKDARLEGSVVADDGEIVGLVLADTTYGKDWFRVNFNPRLVTRLVATLLPAIAPRHSLPAAWMFTEFSLDQYRRILFTLQGMLWGWTVARNHLAANGLRGMGYRSSVWVVSRDELLNRLRRYTGVDVGTIDKVLTLVTFGSSGIRNPDISTQPLVDLRNGFFALAPFVWLNINAERNFCVLLNQIPEQKQIYDRLKNEKESLLKAEMRDFLIPLGFDIRSGEVDGTDLDIAIIDRKNQACLCLELKWFIEPAEVREIEEKTRELKNGVDQAKKICALHESRDARLVRDILDIHEGYSFLVAVASQNWIGHSGAQDDDIPIIKVWHLLRRIRDTGSLPAAMQWLSSRDYLPKEGSDFAIVPIEISCGGWTCEWYGIKPLVEATVRRSTS